MLSRTGEYALQAIIAIARGGDGVPMLGKDIANQTHIPLKYLQKILRDLVRADLLRSLRGMGGGYTLARSPRDVCVRDIVEPFDSWVKDLPCPFGSPACDAGDPCPAHQKWEPLRRAYHQFLELTTLEDLIGPN